MDNMGWTMDFSVFVEFMKEKVQMCLGENVIVECQEVLKGNGVKLQALQIREETASLSPVIYLEGLYEDYMEGKPVATCVKEVCDIYLNNQLIEREADALVEGIKSWDMSKADVYPILISYDGNEELLKNLIHRPYLDLALCYAICMDDEKYGRMTIRVSHGLLTVWGIDVEELHEQAFENMKGAGYQLKKISQVLVEMGVIDEVDARLDDGGFSILTNQRKQYGAAGMLNTDLLARFADMVKSNLFLLPSSVHEIIVVPDNGAMTLKEYTEMVQDVNATMVRKEEKLSDHPYYYDREKGVVRVAG